MSKQSEAKEQQQYVSKAAPETCSTCRHFEWIENVYTNPDGTRHYSDTNLRCGIGGFAVKKMGTCRLWEPMDAL